LKADEGLAVIVAEEAGEGTAAVEAGPFRMGIDIGGTFTDFAVIDHHTGAMTVEKTPTTPSEIWTGIEAGIGKLDLALEEMALIVHGTTVGLNALLERTGKRTGLITTYGFRDVYEIGRHNRTETYDLFYRKPVPPIPRRFRLEVCERMDEQGRVVGPLHEEDVHECMRTLAQAGITAVAVCLLHSYANPEHEQMIAELAARDYPEMTVSLSHTLARQWREYERTSTTAVNAYIMATVGDYLKDLEYSLAAKGYRRRLFVNKSAGGIMSVDVARTKPVHTIMSGPAGGAMAAAYVGGLSAQADVIAFDMGGTSTDISLVHKGDLRVTIESEIDRNPLMVPMIDVHSIGAGGGSIAWLDAAGALNVGPESAGAEPGPLCYGRGGQEPTVTDADLVVGRLHPEHFLGGEIRLDLELARRQIHERIGRPLGLGAREAAMGIIEIANTKMAHAVRAITVERGLDPREFALLAFGGAGPMHACAIARALGVVEAIVPLGPGAFSALGMVVSDLRHDFVRTSPAPIDDDLPVEELNERFREMRDEATAVLRAEGTSAQSMDFRPSIDVRYVGQEHAITVPLEDEAMRSERMPSLLREFHALHEQNYGHASPGEPTEIVNQRLVAIGKVARPDLAEVARGDAAPAPGALVGQLDAWAQQDGHLVASPTYDRDKLAAGNRIVGPALVVEKSATTVVEVGFVLTVQAQGQLSLRREEQ
jgi:N-methylhydantoinase A